VALLSKLEIGRRWAYHNILNPSRSILLSSSSTSHEFGSNIPRGWEERRVSLQHVHMVAMVTSLGIGPGRDSVLDCHD
jgi:hypothetical protein